MSVGHLYSAGLQQGDQPRLFSPEEYQRMVAEGVIGRDEHVELIGGMVCIPSGREPEPRRFSIDEYYRLAELGVLGPDERVELIDGVVYKMSPIGSWHNSTVMRLARLLARSLGDAFLVQVQGPIRLPDRPTQLEPDLAVLEPREDFYKSELPAAANVRLVIEVMDTSAVRDRGQKLIAYARGGVREVWLVDLEDETVEVHVEPERGGYTRSFTRERGETIATTTVPGLVLAVDDFLG